MDNFDLKKYLAEGKLLKEEEVDVLGNEFLQDIQDTMKMYYKMDVDMDDIKDWVNMYYIGYNSEYDNEEDKKELVFDTTEREDFYMHLNPDAESTFPNLSEGRLFKEGEYTYMNDANTEFGPDVLDLDYDKIRHYIANIKGDDFANNFLDGYNDDFYENVVRFFDKIENPTDEEVINFIDIEIKKYLAENKLLKEALNKPMNEFGKDLEKRLNTLGFETKLFMGQKGVPQEASDAIITDPKKAGISYIKMPNGYEHIEVMVNSSKINQLKKVKSYFQTADGNYSPDKKIGWVVKNVKITNPGDIIGSDIVRYGDRSILSYYTSTEGEKVKTRDINENAPGYDTRKTGDALPTLESVKAAYEAKNDIKETLVDADQDMAEAILNALGGEAAFEAVVRAMSTDDAQIYLGGIMRDYDIEMKDEA